MDKRKSIRQKVYDKYNGRCAYCGKDINYEEMKVDRIVPDLFISIEEGLMSNLVPACGMCYSCKRYRSLAAFRTEIDKKARRAMQGHKAELAMAYGLIEYHPERNAKFYFEKYEKDHGERKSYR